MAQIPNIDIELLRGAARRTGLGDTLSAGLEGYEKGVGIASKIQQRKMQQKQLEMAIEKARQESMLQQQQQQREQRVADLTRPITPEAQAAPGVPLSQVASVEPETGQVLQTGPQIARAAEAQRLPALGVAEREAFPLETLKHSQALEMERLKQRGARGLLEAKPTTQKGFTAEDLKVIRTGDLDRIQQRFQDRLLDPQESKFIESQISQAEKQQLRQRTAATAGVTVLGDLERGLNEFFPKIPDNTFFRIGQAKIPGNPTYEFFSRVDSAKSNVGLDRLQLMREGNPSGGALGQVPFKQQLRLEQVYGAINPGMSKQELEVNTQRLYNIYLDVVFGNAQDRQKLIREGKMSPQENQEVEGYYYPLPIEAFRFEPKATRPKASKQIDQINKEIEDIRRQLGEN